MTRATVCSDCLGVVKLTEPSASRIACGRRADAANGCAVETAIFSRLRAMAIAWRNAAHSMPNSSPSK
ncbi:hypothetical protein OKW38_007120 [Paraburkholderia sp. MM5496-R1]|uniref:hypothetical protein n=1 Tax=Paraburkholderia sp. MM5496-R1 TaxID=2991065 RepID=UPI003D1E932F